jgi:hypothetical protein
VGSFIGLVRRGSTHLSLAENYGTKGGALFRAFGQSPKVDILISDAHPSRLPSWWGPPFFAQHFTQFRITMWRALCAIAVVAGASSGHRTTYQQLFDLEDVQADAANMHEPIASVRAAVDERPHDKVGYPKPAVECPHSAKYGWEKIKALGGCNAKYASAIAPFEEFVVDYHWAQVQDGVLCEFSLTSKDHGFTLQVSSLPVRSRPPSKRLVVQFGFFIANSFGLFHWAGCAGPQYQRGTPTGGRAAG